MSLVRDEIIATIKKAFEPAPDGPLSRPLRRRRKPKKVYFSSRRRVRGWDRPDVYLALYDFDLYNRQRAMEEEVLENIRTTLQNALALLTASATAYKSALPVEETAAGTPAYTHANLNTFHIAPPPDRVFESRDWSAIEYAMTALLLLLKQLVELILNLLQPVSILVAALPPPQPTHTAPCAVARLQGTRVPRAPQVPLSHFSLAS